MRISDWSSDVCSSDLRRRPRIADGRPVPPSHPHAQAAPARQGRRPAATARSGPPVTCRNYFTSRQYSFFSSQARKVKNARNRNTQTQRLWRLSAAGYAAYPRQTVVTWEESRGGKEGIRTVRVGWARRP